MKLIQAEGASQFPGYRVDVLGSMIGIEPPQGRKWRDKESVEIFVRELERRAKYIDINFRIVVGFDDVDTGEFSFIKHADVKGGKLGNYFWPPHEDYGYTALIYWTRHLFPACTP